MLSIFPLLKIDTLSFAVFLTAMATTQSFVDFIPSIFLGVPDEETVLSVLPSHKLLLEGRGMEAVRITALASLYGVIISLAFLPIAFYIVPLAYSAVRMWIVPILAFAIFFLIMREKKRLWALLTFLLSGYLGWTCLHINLSTSDVFLPLFSGLFGLSGLLMGIQAGSRFYPQEDDAKVRLSERGLWRYSFLGAVGGLLVGLLPAMSPSQVGILFQELRAMKERAKIALEELHIREFLTMVASLNTADAMFSIFAVYLMNNPRSGISVIIQELFGRIDIWMLIMLCAVMVVVGGLSYFIHLEIGRMFSRLAGRMNFQRISALGFLLVVAMVFLMTGLFGLLIAMVSMMVGLIPALSGVSRTHAMGCLLLPTLLFFLGV